MYDILTAAQTALSPATMFYVIVALAIIIAAQAYFGARRMKDTRKQARAFAKATMMLLVSMTVEHKRDTERQIGQAIEHTFDALKEVGFDKLASGEVTFEGVMFGDTPFKSESRRHRRDRDPIASLLADILGGPHPGGIRPDPFDLSRSPRDHGPASFSMDELREAFGGKPRFGDAKPGTEPHSFEEPLKNAADEGAGLGEKGPRPFHRATHDFSGHSPSPRAG